MASPAAHQGHELVAAGLLLLAGVVDGDRLIEALQPSQPGDSLGEPATRQHPAFDIHQLDVVMGLSPVVPDEQHLDDLLSTASREPAEEI